MLLLAASGCDSWYGYRIAGVVTRENGIPVGGIVVVPSMVPYQLVGPPRSDRTAVTATRIYARETGQVLAAVTSPDGRYEDRELGDFVESAFSPPAQPLHCVFVYVWQDGWSEHRIPVGKLPQPLINKWTREIRLPPIKIPVPTIRQAGANPN